MDVFPAADTEPVRLEFVGDMVETLRRFDPATQRSTGPIDQVLIVPVRELFDDDDRLTRTPIQAVGPSAVRRQSCRCWSS